MLCSVVLWRCSSGVAGQDIRGGCTSSRPVPSPEARALCPAPRPALCSPSSLPALQAAGPSACPMADHQTDLETSLAAGSLGTFLRAGAAGSCLHVGPKPAPCREPIPRAPLKPLELGEPQHLPLLGTVGSWGVEGKTTPRECRGSALVLLSVLPPSTALQETKGNQQRVAHRVAQQVARSWA